MFKVTELTVVRAALNLNTIGIQSLYSLHYPPKGSCSIQEEITLLGQTKETFMEEVSKMTTLEALHTERGSVSMLEVRNPAAKTLQTKQRP